MNGPIQISSSGGGGGGCPGRSTQLRPSVMSNNGGPLRRSLGFNSQIPIRIGFVNQSTSSSQQASLRARVLERHRQSLVNSNSNSSSTSSSSSPSSHQSSAANANQQQQQQPFIDNAFKVYEDKLQTDFRDFRAICSRLILQEKEEKEKWHSLCLKLMKERDTARQRINALISERSSSSSFAFSSAQEKVVVSKASKRGRDDESESASTSSAAQELPSRSSPVESRPIRSLRLSPVSSPPGSPSASLYNNSSSSTAMKSSPPPLSATSESSPLPSNSDNANVVLTSTTSTTPPPLNIMTFNPARSPNDKTCFDVFGEFDIPESRPVKRRKSYDSSSSSSGETTKGSFNNNNNNNSGPSQRNEKDKSDGGGDDDDEPLPFLIAHTDIMYMPMKGRLYCRACL